MSSYRYTTGERLQADYMLAYSVIAYDKDGDVCDAISQSDDKDAAIRYAEIMTKEMESGKLRRKDNNEPYDWIEVYENWGKQEEELVWASYEQEKERE